MLALFSALFFGIVGAFLVLMSMGISNSLRKQRNKVDNSWISIEELLKNRSAALKPLLEVFDKKSVNEKAILDKIIYSDKKFQTATRLSDKITATNELTNAIKAIFAIGDAYPEIRAFEAYLEMKSVFLILDNKLNEKFEDLNEHLFVYNSVVQDFPDMFYAGFMGYGELPILQISDEEKRLLDLSLQAAA